MRKLGFKKINNQIVNSSLRKVNKIIFAILISNTLKASPVLAAETSSVSLGIARAAIVGNYAQKATNSKFVAFWFLANVCSNCYNLEENPGWCCNCTGILIHFLHLIAKSLGK